MSNFANLSGSSALEAGQNAARQIPPLWPLTTSVAVNPFLGQAGESLECTAARLERVAGVRLTMSRSWFAQRIAAGDITDGDLEVAAAAVSPGLGLDAKSLRRLTTTERAAPEPLVTIAELAAEASGIAWPEIIEDRIGAWAASYFDEGQAFWAAAKDWRAYPAWRATAMHDLTPEILGLKDLPRALPRPRKMRSQQSKPLLQNSGSKRERWRRISTSFCLVSAAGRSTRAISNGTQTCRAGTIPS